jgi:phosphotransferase system enzyme I (PtsI)
MESTAEKEIRYTGLAVSEGVVLARAFVMSAQRHSVPIYRIAPDDAGGEIVRLENAMQSAVGELSDLMAAVARRVGPAQAKIFEAQRMMIEDPVLKEQFLAVIHDEALNAEAAVDKTLDRYEALLREVDDEYLMERASDIGEVRHRLLDKLRAAEFAEPTRVDRDVFDFGEPRIVVAHELTPGETVRLDMQNTVGFITERGGAASHAAILARALGIPAVSGIQGIHTSVTHGQEILLDGTSGEVVLWPTKRTLQVYPNASRGGQPQTQTVPPVPGLTVLANISLAEEAERLGAVEAEGVGLYRTEYEFFARGRLVNEDEQYHLYARVVDAMQGRPVHIRLLDMGGDKPAPFLDIPKEEKPLPRFSRGASVAGPAGVADYAGPGTRPRVAPWRDPRHLPDDRGHDPVPAAARNRCAKHQRHTGTKPPPRRHVRGSLGLYRRAGHPRGGRVRQHRLQRSYPVPLCCGSQQQPGRLRLWPRQGAVLDIAARYRRGRARHEAPALALR